MTVTSIDKDYDTLTTTLVADFEASIEEVWQLWADPRKLERWWGPPTYPATFEQHDLSPGGEVAYFMTGPDGDRPRGWWRVTSVDPPTSLRFTDGFAHDDGTPNDEMPTIEIDVRLSPDPPSCVTAGRPAGPSGRDADAPHGLEARAAWPRPGAHRAGAGPAGACTCSGSGLAESDGRTARADRWIRAEPASRRYPRGGAVDLPVPRGHGQADRDGHARRHGAGGRADGRAARVVA